MRCFNRPTQTGLKIRRVLILPLILLSLSLLSVPGGSADTNKLENQKRQNETTRKNLKKELSRKKLLERDISEQFRKVDTQLDRTEREYRKKNNEYRNVQLEEQYYKKQLRLSQEKFKSYRNSYKDRLVAYYKNGRAGYLEVLFNSTSFSDFISRMTYLRILTKNDLDMMGKLRELREEVADKSRQVENTRMEIELARESLAQEKQQIAEIHRGKRRALKEIQSDVRLLEKQYAEMERENQRIEKELQKARGLGPKYNFDGRFGSPVCTNSFSVSSHFGPRKPPKRGASSNHRGTDIRASYGADICAAADGVVFQAGYRQGGYGLSVILLHGSDYSTVYAHGMRVLVREGQNVRKGQIIMKADSTGTSTGNHLHFEIRKGGVAVNPMNYF